MSSHSRLKTIKTITQVKSNQTCENKRQALSQIKRIDWKSLDFRTKNQKSFYDKKKNEGAKSSRNIN